MILCEKNIFFDYLSIFVTLGAFFAVSSFTGGGGTPLNKLCRYVPPQRAWFLSRFGLKRGIDFDHYGLKSGMVFKGTTGAYKRICLFQLQMNRKRKRSVPSFILLTHTYILYFQISNCNVFVYVTLAFIRYPIVTVFNCNDFCH